MMTGNVGSNVTFDKETRQIEEDRVRMPPPSRRYIPGTEDFEKALRSGKIHSSIFVQRSHNRKRTVPTDTKSRKCFLVAPDVDSDEKGFADNDKEHDLDGSDSSLSYSKTYITSTDIETSYNENPESSNISTADSMEMEDDDRDKSRDECPSPAVVSLQLPVSGDREKADEDDGTCTKDDKQNSVESSQSPPPGKLSVHFETTRFSDVIGHGNAKLRIDEILLPMGLPSSISVSVLSGIRSQPTSILLFGPPGCGKTQLARAVAGEAQAAFFSVAPSDVLSKFVGESEGAIRSIFQKATKAASKLDSKCSVIFFDEIDALGHTRENGGAGEGEGCSRRVLAELLMQFNTTLMKTPAEQYKVDGKNYDDTNNGENETIRNGDCEPPRVLVIAATNRPEDCDPALMRRFGIRLKIGLPSCRDRNKMFNSHLMGIDHALSKIDMHNLALATEGWSGSDIESLAREAVMAPIRECLRMAAIHRRRMMKDAQRSEQESSSQTATAGFLRDEAQQYMMQNLQQLRQVRLEDFENAICVLSKGELVSHINGKLFGPKRTENHYDSSSDEEM